MSKSLNFKNLLSEYGEYSDFCAAIKSGKTPVSGAGLVQSAMPQFIYQTQGEKRAIVITYNDNEAKQLVEELEFYEMIKSVIPKEFMIIPKIGLDEIVKPNGNLLLFNA